MKLIKDERIIKANNKLTAPMYPWILALTAVTVIIKLLLKQPIQMYLLEMAAVVLSIGFTVIGNAQKGILFSKAKDEHIIETKNHIRMIAFMICFMIYVIGEFVLMLLYIEKISIIALYIPIWFIPGIVLTFRNIKKGVFIWGTSKAKNTGLKKFKRSVLIGSLFFGVFMGFPHLWQDGAFNPWGIVWILGMAVGWGIPFYFIMKLLMTKSETYADREVAQAELESNTYEE